MGSSTRAILLFAAAVLAVCLSPAAVQAAAAPQVFSVIEGRDTSTDRPVLVLLGKGLTKFQGFRLEDPSALRVPEDLETLLRSRTLLVLGLPGDLAPGEYDLVGTTRNGDSPTFRVKVHNEAPLPGVVAWSSLEPDLIADLDDAATLGGDPPSSYRDASNLEAGTLSPDRYSAHADLLAESKVGTGTAQVAEGDHDHDASYATEGHGHGGLYLTESELSAEGTLNAPGNPVDWTMLKGVPAGFADGTDGDAWTTSGSDVHRSGGRVGIGTSAPSAGLHVAGVDGALFTGAGGAGGIPATGAGTRMMWYPGKSAFRAGLVTGGQWDDAGVGNYSSATGINTSAIAIASTALGYYTTASGNFSTAMGKNTVASGTYAVSMGGDNSATGEGSTAMGYLNVASGDGSTAMGGSNVAGGANATAMGAGTTASGVDAVSMGSSTTAQPFAAVAMGRWNVVAGTTTSWVSTDPVLVVGNGTSSSATSNAFTLLKDGNLTIAGTLTQNSDARLKEDLEPLGPVLRRVAALRGMSYRLKDATKGPGGRHIGLLAQDVREAFPELVREDSEGTLSVAYGNLSAVLVEAVKDLQGLLDAREREVVALRKELGELRAASERRFSRLEALLADGPAGEGSADGPTSPPSRR